MSQDPPPGARVSGRRSDRSRAVAVAVLFEGGLLGLAWGLGRLLDRPAWQSLHWDARAAGLGVAACLPLLLVFLLLIRCRCRPVTRIRQFFEEVVRPLLGACSLFELAVIALLAGLGEETLFRDVLQGAFSHWLGPWPALVLAGALFGLMHPITPLYVVIAALFGVYLGACWLASGNLLVAIIAHGLYDFLALVYLLRVRQSGDQGSGSQGPDRLIA
jgi:membrane protease YdiL (CAAX protease family)